MRNRTLLAVLIILFMMVTAAGNSESNNPARIIPDEEWSWKTGANNIFEGELDLKAYPGREVSISMACDLPYEESEKADKSPVFTIVNGKRIQMLKQSSTARCTIDQDNPVVSFSGRMILPEKKHVNAITFQFTVTDENGQEITKAEALITGNGDNNDRQFFIPVDIKLITAILSTAAAIIWIAVLTIKLKKKSVRRKIQDENI